MNEPKSLGRYRIQGVLGKGAMGMVYDGLDPGLNRRVAIKTILTRKLDAEAARMISVRFEREVRAVARLNHGNIVQVYDFGTEGDLAYIVMEHIQGKELKDHFDAHERFDLKTIFRLMAELLDALDFAHEAGVIHRDIKPANVMIDAAGHAKVRASSPMRSTAFSKASRPRTSTKSSLYRRPPRPACKATMRARRTTKRRWNSGTRSRTATIPRIWRCTSSNSRAEHSSGSRKKRWPRYAMAADSRRRSG